MDKYIENKANSMFEKDYKIIQTELKKMIDEIKIACVDAACEIAEQTIQCLGKDRCDRENCPFYRAVMDLNLE